MARNSALNLIGQGIPLLAAFFAIPLLLRGLGTDRFGVLTLAWIVIGYFSLFDLGLGRALTQVVSATLGERPSTVAPPIVWPALALMFALGVVGAIVVGVCAPFFVHAVLKIPASMQHETLVSFFILAVAIPVVVVTTGYAGILAAFNRFKVLNLIRAPMGAFTFLAPVAVLPFSRSLIAVTAALAFGRVAAAIAHALACAALMPPLRAVDTSERNIRPLFRFGAWMTVSNVVGPLMLYLDRFVIGSTITVAAVAFYATPYEMVTKMLIVPGAILGVLFPALSSGFGRRDPRQLDALLLRGIRLIALILFPALLLVVAFAPEGLNLWLGREFADKSTAVLRCMAVGVFINAIAQVFATMIQAAGRPDITAKLHLLELPLYLMLLWWLIGHFGIFGAALAWTARAALDAVLLLICARPFFGDARHVVRCVVAGMSSAVAVLLIPIAIPSLLARAVSAALIGAGVALTAWFHVLDSAERSAISRSARLA